jgi:hypothetical protein
MPHSVYLVLHLLGIFLLTLSIGGTLVKKQIGDQSRMKVLAMLHGFGLFFIFLAGFGLIARLGISWPFPIWIWLKLTIWLAFGAFSVFAARMSNKVAWIAAIVIFLGAAILGVYKPF